VTVGGRNEVLIFRRSPGFSPKPIATIKTGDLPHGIWNSGDGGRVYVGLENGDSVQAIDTTTNRCVATIPVGQLPLVYVPNAVASDHGTANLRPLDLAAEALHLELTPPPGVTSAAHASVAINSLGPIDNLQIAATGLEPGKKYSVLLVGSREPQELVQRRDWRSRYGAGTRTVEAHHGAVAGAASDDVGTRREEWPVRRQKVLHATESAG
jgi:YVTN family beta-propeller protein